MKISPFVFSFLFLVLTFSFISAFDFLDFTFPIRQGDCFNVFGVCENCSYMNITILYPNGTPIVTNEAMSNLDACCYYNYTFCNTSDLGIYPVIFCWESEGNMGGETDFLEVTSTGTDQLSILQNPTLLLLIVVSLLLIVGAFAIKMPSIGFLGALALIISGVYMMIYGLNTVADFYTRTVAGIMIGVGIIFMIIISFELFQKED